MQEIKIGVFTDAHANIQALNGILNEFNSLGCSEIFNLGDVIGLGAYHKECLECVLSTKNLTNVAGNHELLYIRGVDNISKPIADKEEEMHHRQVHNMLGEDFKKIVSTFPLQVDRQWFGHKITFLHYARKDNRFVVPAKFPDAEFFDDIYSYLDSDIVLFGHEHIPIILKSRRRYVDVGSLSCNREDTANAVMLTISPDAVKIDTVKVPYDKTRFIAEMYSREIIRRDFLCSNFFGKKVDNNTP